MKKIFLLLTLTTLVVTSCRNDDEETTTTTEVTLETQNAYDDEAAQKYLAENYFDSRGNIVAFSSTLTTDDNEKPLKDYNPVKLASGVIYIMREGAQPSVSNAILEDDALSIMQVTTTHVATKTDNVVKFTSTLPFKNTIAGTGTPEYDPAYYHVKQSVLEKYNTDFKTTYTDSFFEIEGLKEALTMFQSFSLQNSDNYNLQGVIIVPSRAAFARDKHFNHAGYLLNNRSFVFNFQVYNRKARSIAGN